MALRVLPLRSSHLPKLLELIANLPACLIGIEACSGAHHWAREFAKYGHTVRMMAPKFVVPYRMSGKRGKNDAAMPLRFVKPSSADEPLDNKYARAPGVLEGRGGHCGQKCVHVLGDVAAGRAIQDACVSGTAYVVSPSTCLAPNRRRQKLCSDAEGENNQVSWSIAARFC